jgi:hypothetical protein
MTQDQTSGREPVPSFTPISATKVDNPKQTEFRLVSPAPAETEPEADSAVTSPTTPVPAVPSQSRRAATGNASGSGADSAADTAPDLAAPDLAADRGGRLAEGEELMPGAQADEPLPSSPGEDEPPADDLMVEELLPPGAIEDEPPARDRADEELLPPGAFEDEPPARDGLDDEPLLSGLEELRAGWQRARMAFVDNPRGAVAEAAGLTDEAAEALAAALRERRHRIRTTWDGDGSGRDTEALRLALLRYQALFSKIVGGLARGARVR